MLTGGVWEGLVLMCEGLRDEIVSQRWCGMRCGDEAAGSGRLASGDEEREQGTPTGGSEAQ